MKKVFILIVLILLAGTNLIAQVSITTDNSAPAPSAMLEVKSNSKGFLPPVMTTVEMFSISAPAEGLMVYNLSMHSLVFYNGSGWKRIDGQHFVGENFGGGVVFYLDSTNLHGLISSTSDQETYSPWGNYGIPVPGGTSAAIGSGQANTTTIVNAFGNSCWAAWRCDQLDLNSYSDWFLPSKDELNEMYLHNAEIGGFGAFGFYYYWSSTEYDAYEAWFLNFNWGGNASPQGKHYAGAVRAVRAF